MLCELVFMSYADLERGQQVAVTGQPGRPGAGHHVPDAARRRPTSPRPTRWPPTLFAALGAQPVLGEDGLGLQTADLGGVAHEVGTLRMAGDGTGVVDANLKFLAYDNLYACDNSVFPASPAANPSLTTAALALRLAAHLDLVTPMLAR